MFLLTRNHLAKIRAGQQTMFEFDASGEINELSEQLGN
jgi:hypothetical protein